MTSIYNTHDETAVCSETFKHGNITMDETELCSAWVIFNFTKLDEYSCNFMNFLGYFIGHVVSEYYD